MEEFIGEVWHKFISRQVLVRYPESAVELLSTQQQLTTWFRALGGSAGQSVEAVDARVIPVHRSLIQKVAGSHRKFFVAWQDERSLRLPASIDYLPTSNLNEFLYFWLASMAAELPTINNWFRDNQQATIRILKCKPGLKSDYFALAKEIVKHRPNISDLPEALQAREKAIQQALLQPGSVDVLPCAEGQPWPVFMWLYSPPIQMVANSAHEEDEDTGTPSKSAEVDIEELETPRKQTKQVDDKKETDGLLVFKLDALFSWTESVDLDRPQEEDLENDLQTAANDLDIITLSRQRKAGSAKVKFDLDLPAPQQDDLPIGNGTKLPEWDFRRSVLIQDYCLLQPMLSDDAQPTPLPEYLRVEAQALKRYFASIAPQSKVEKHQPYGDEIDIDAWLAYDIQQRAKQVSQEAENLYQARKKSHRDLSTLVLADLSMSTDSQVSTDQRVIDIIRDSLLLFSESLNSCQDPFAIYGFSSVKNKQVRFQLLKNFSETYSDYTRGRIMAIQPGFYTRMGAAIRQSTQILTLQRSRQKLLLILSDGKPNDIDHYEGRYGIEDTRQAIIEAKQAGLQPFCITIDEKGSSYLPYLFGEQGYALVSDIHKLPKLLPQLYVTLTGHH